MKTITASILLTFLLVLAGSCKKDKTSCTVTPPSGLLTVSLRGGVYATLRWDSVQTAALGYTLQYRISGTSAWTQVGTTTNDTLLLSGLTPNTFYEWQVQSICSNGNGSAFSDIGTFQTGALIGSCSLDSTISFFATNFVASPANKSIMVYVNDTSTYISFAFSTYPISSGTYLLVAPGSSTPGNTAVMTAKFDGGVPSYSTGIDGVNANVTVTGGKISLSLPKGSHRQFAEPIQYIRVLQCYYQSAIRDKVGGRWLA
jgi:hypothetical protein